MLNQLFMKCTYCGSFVPVEGNKKRASKYCGKSCRDKAYYRRKKAGAVGKVLAR